MATNPVYLDYAATNPIRPEVLRVIFRTQKELYGNAGSIHRVGLEAKKILDAARSSVARAFEAHSDEIIFTSGGTEGNNMAILGVVESLRSSAMPYTRMHAVTSKIEHSSVREVFKELRRRGVRVSEVNATRDGVINLVAFQSALRPNTVLVSIMHANNEIGTIQPIARIAKVTKAFKKVNSRRPIANNLKYRLPIFHVDACQSPLYLPIQQSNLGADLIVVDAQKIGGPKGVGALYARRGVPLLPIMYGGGQEKGLRPGTENVPAIAGLAEALAIAAAKRRKESKRLIALRDDAITLIQKQFPLFILNGSRENRLPNNINISFPNLDAEFAVIKLAELGVAVSSKSACVESDSNSYVLEAIGRSPALSKGALRITMGFGTKKADIERLLQALRRVIPTVS